MIFSTCILQFTMHAMIGKSYKLLRSFGMSTLQPLLGAIVEEITHFYINVQQPFIFMRVNECRKIQWIMFQTIFKTKTNLCIFLKNSRQIKKFLRCNFCKALEVFSSKQIMHSKIIVRAMKTCIDVLKRLPELGHSMYTSHLSVGHS